MGSRGIITAGPLPDDATALIEFDTLLQQLDQLLDRHLADGALSDSTVHALRIVEGAGRRGVRQCVLAEAMHLPAATVSRLVDTLVKNDLVSRSAHPTDRRVTVLALTTVGEQRLARRRADYRVFAEALTPGADEAIRAATPLLSLLVQTLATTARDQAA